MDVVADVGSTALVDGLPLLAVVFTSAAVSLVESVC